MILDYNDRYMGFQLCWDGLPPSNTTKKSQVVTATINSALSREREPESDPVRLQKEVKTLNPVDIMEQIRKSKGITKTHIAKQCGRTVSWYADIAKGRRRVYLDDFVMIANAMGENAKNFFDHKLSETLNPKPKKKESA